MARSAASGRKPKNKGQSKGGPAKKGTKGKGKSPGGGSDKKSGGRGRGGRQPEKKEKPATAEELDSAMDDYWLKGKNKEVAGKKLDEDMDAYWEKKNAAKETKGEEAAPAATTTDEAEAENEGEKPAAS